MTTSSEPANSSDFITYPTLSLVQAENRELLRSESSKQLRHPIVLNLENKLTSSVCRIQYDGVADIKFGTGFLCKIKAKNKLCFGLVTNSHIIQNIDHNYLQNVKVIFKERTSRLDEVFYLSDENIGDLHASYSDIDATFIELSEQFQSHLRKSEREFLETATNLNADDSILLIQYPEPELASGQTSRLSTGQILDSQLVWDLPPGCELHTAFTLPGNSGSPILINGKVFGIHKGSSKYKEANTLVRIQYLIDKLNGKTVEEIISTGVLK